VFERFTPEARQVVVAAQEEARTTLRHSYIGTEHLFLGLARDEQSSVARLLASFGLPIERIRAEVVLIVGTGEEASEGQMPFTAEAKKVLEMSLREALSRNDTWIGSEHILLAITHERTGVPASILRDAGVDLRKLRGAVVSSPPRGQPRRRLLGERPSPTDVETGWIEGLRPVLDPLAEEIREHLGREPDAGDLLRVLACIAPEQHEAVAELEGQLREVGRAKEAAVRAQEFDEAGRLRDQERTLMQGMTAALDLGAETLRDIRRRLGLPGPP
jgi:ATP-dependent Clp protease ATP-binding subunit ClpA